MSCPRLRPFPSLVLAAATSRAADLAWPTHGGDPGHRQHSALAQIHRGNVKQLARGLDLPHAGTRAPTAGRRSSATRSWWTACSTRTSPQLKVFALDAATGQRAVGASTPSRRGDAQASLGVNRGRDLLGRRRGPADPRHRGASASSPSTRGRASPIPTFGDKGSVSLLEGLDRDVTGLYVLSNTPGAIYKDLLILGTRVSEGPGASAPGHIRAYDVRTGKIRWIFHTIPQPGEFGYDTWPADAWKRIGGANAWSGISVDEERGLVFLPTGSAAFDFWGGNREGANLFANCVLVLKAATGERVWHYQLVHHDLWDRDLPAAPGARARDARRQEGRRGRADHQVGPRVPVRARDGQAALSHRGAARRRPPTSQGERAWPTQPLPALPPALRAAGAHRGRPERPRPGSARATSWTRFRKLRSGGPVDAAEPRGHGDLSRLRRGRRVGRAPPSTRTRASST